MPKNPLYIFQRTAVFDSLEMRMGWASVQAFGDWTQSAWRKALGRPRAIHFPCARVGLGITQEQFELVAVENNFFALNLCQSETKMKIVSKQLPSLSRD